MTATSSAPLFRLRASYVKHGRLAYLGHLELIHTIERIVRRAGLPFAVTQGVQGDRGGNVLGHEEVEVLGIR